MHPILVRFITIPAILRAFCLIFQLVGFICAQSIPYRSGRAVFYCVMSMIEFVATLIMLAIYLTKIDFVLQANWHKIELHFSAFGVLVYVLISSLVIGDYSELLTVAGVFGYFAMIIFIIEVYLKYRQTHTTSVTNNDNMNDRINA